MAALTTNPMIAPAVPAASPGKKPPPFAKKKAGPPAAKKGVNPFAKKKTGAVATGKAPIDPKTLASMKSSLKGV